MSFGMLVVQALSRRPRVFVVYQRMKSRGMPVDGLIEKTMLHLVDLLEVVRLAPHGRSFHGENVGFESLFLLMLSEMQAGLHSVAGPRSGDCSWNVDIRAFELLRDLKDWTGFLKPI